MRIDGWINRATPEKDKPPTVVVDWNGFWSTLVGVIVCWSLLMHMPDFLHSSWRYRIQYSLPESALRIEKKPHDCDWWKAPLGDKYCHYEANEAVLWSGLDSHGKKVISTDRKTWSPDDYIDSDYDRTPAQYKSQNVILEWEKKEE